MDQRFQATFKENPAFWFFGVFATFLIAVSLGARSWPLAAIGFGIISFLLALRFRLAVNLDEAGMAFQGLVHARRIEWPEITGTSWKANSGYLYQRWFGPTVLEICTGRDKVRINLKFFSKACSQELFRELSNRGLSPQTRRAVSGGV